MDQAGHLLPLVLSARNMALAEEMNTGEDILIPCSACYLNLKKTMETIRQDPETLEKVNMILKEEQLHLEGRLNVRHLLDVMTRDIGPETVKSLIKDKLTGMVIAPYYGCQCLRPYAVFDDPEVPVSMEPLIEAVGAEVHPWKMGGRCCGASHMNTKMDVGMALSGAILHAAKGADAIVTVCPMCQINLEGYQRRISKSRDEDLKMTILYLPQLIGLAFGLSEKDLRIDMNLAVKEPFISKLHECRS
ncbi:MAG: disulfide reductase, partial [Desulfobacterales bacterium]|nr:disulfide reductase [Desulfobacterales bacterium]